MNSTITIIAAVGKNNELGVGNDLIWHFKEDMQFFKENTLHKPCVMGLKTYFSLPHLLKDRLHLVLTDKYVDLPGEVIKFYNLESLLDFIRATPNEYMIIGGASIYRLFLPYADRMLLTEIHASQDADVYFPMFNKKEWSREVLSSHVENEVKFDHVQYVRKKSQEK